jgi:hypothetical protein
MTRGFLLIFPSAVIIRDWLLWGDPETPSTVRAVRNCQFGNAFREAPQLQSQLPTKPSSDSKYSAYRQAAEEIFRRTSRHSFVILHSPRVQTHKLCRCTVHESFVCPDGI